MLNESEVFFDNLLYTLFDAWQKSTNFPFRRARPLLVFAMLPKNFRKALNMARAQSLQVIMTELNENGNGLM